MRQREHVFYGLDSDPERCRLDVYHTDRGDPRHAPLIVYIHGGGWIMGNHMRTRNNCDWLSQTFNVVAVSYRLSGLSWHTVQWFIGFVSVMCLMMIRTRPWLVLLTWFVLVAALSMLVSDNNVQHPTHVLDVARATAWAKKHVDYNGSIYLMGHSAGAHLASLLGVHSDYRKGLEQDIRGVICLAGVYNPARLRAVTVGKLLHFEVFGGEEEDAFPIYHVKPDSPPHLLLNASDDMSLKRHTLDYFMTLREAGVFVRSRVYPRTNHFTLCRNWDTTRAAVLNDIRTFVLAIEGNQSVSDAPCATDGE